VTRVPARRREVAGIAVAIVAVVVVGVLVLTVGMQPYPQLPTVSEQPDPAPPAAVATLSYGADGICVVVLDRDGSRRELRCADEYGGGEVTWTDAGDIDVPRWDATGSDVLDPRTGEVVDRTPTARGERDPADLAIGPDGARLVVHASGGRVEVGVDDGGGERLLWEADGPDSYHLRTPTWSPDGRFATVTDSADRLIVLHVDGDDPAPRIWARDLGGAVSWGPTAGG
jgi:hypothetical protein